MNIDGVAVGAVASRVADAAAPVPAAAALLLLVLPLVQPVAPLVLPVLPCRSACCHARPCAATRCWYCWCRLCRWCCWWVPPAAGLEACLLPLLVGLLCLMLVAGCWLVAAGFAAGGVRSVRVQMLATPGAFAGF